MDKQDFHGNEVAIIGLGGRFPGADDVESFWQNLARGVCSIRFFTDEELQEAGVPHEVLQDPSYVKAGGIIEDVDLFDALFFGYSPREATIIDPQQRLFLECAWSVLEDAGYAAESFSGSIGVFAGTARNTYLLNNLYPNPEVIENIDGFQLLVASDKDHLATRTSYKLNLRGPSVTVQTTCSTSLVAIHLACQSLLSGECDLALAGGVSVKVPAKRGYFYREGGIFSPDGFCRSFDAHAQGTIDASGLGIVALRRLSDALEDRDHIYAILKGSATNNDGALKAGYTAPSIQGQVAVIGEALALAGVDPTEISYIEAHGTGTPLGDPIEIAALSQVFTASSEKVGFCAIGSVKTNIGHTDTAAGVTSVIKVTLALNHRYIPPSLHFVEPNPSIDFAHSPFFVNTNLREWRSNGQARRAGVSGFGLGGTNVHAVLEEAPELPDLEEEPRTYQLLVLSAKTPSALDTATKRLATYLAARQEALCLSDVAWTLQIGRAAFDYRQILVCRDLQEAARDLQAVDSPRLFRSRGEPGKHSLVFLFPGQGTQYVGMGHELYEHEEVFRQVIDQCCEILEPLLGLDLRCVFSAPTAKADFVGDLNQTWLAQPALFIVEYALAKLWMHWGIRPEAFIGHSIGEYVAACLAGVFSLRDALTLIAARGRLVQSVPSGSMLAVSLPYGELELPEGLSLAAINGQDRCVVSGPADLITALERSLLARGVECQELHTSHAFHSSMLEGILPAFANEVQRIHLSPPRIPCLSNVSGTWMTAEQAVEPQYWVQQLRQTVLFGPALEELKTKTSWILLEVGPGQTLSILVHRSLPGYLTLASLPGARSHSSASASMLTALGRLWLAGCSIAWSNLYTGQRRRLSLPTYPFERESFWIDPPASAVTSHGLSRSEQRATKRAVQDWFYLPAWRQSITPRSVDAKSVESANWLILGDAFDFTRQLSASLLERGYHVIYVLKGQEFTQLEEDVYAVNPQNPLDYRLLLTALLIRDRLPTRIIHAWLLQPRAEGQEEAERLAEDKEYGYYSLLFLAQAINNLSHKTPIKIHLLTNEMQAIAGEEELYAGKAAALGLCKVIPQEQSFITCQSIDVVLPAEGDDHEQRLVEILVNELVSDTPEEIIAYRQNQRWVQSFEQVKVVEMPGQPMMLRQRGVYLLVGGLGDIGLLFAEYLAQTVQADLVLLGRSPFPAETSWDAWLSEHAADDETSRTIRRLQAIKRRGSRLMFVQADVSSAEQMRKALAESEAVYGQLNGVIYAAGAPRTTLAVPLQQLDRTASEQQFQPKMLGPLVLEQVLAGKKLDFCLFQSSLSSLLGGLGFGAYAAANLFLDTYVQAHNRRSAVPWMAVNWDGWQLRPDSTTIGTAHITAEEGMRAFAYLFTGITSQIVVSALSLNERRARWINPGGTFQVAEKTDLLKTSHARPHLQSAFVAPRNELEQRVATIWEDFLGIGQISVYDSFFELGGDSLLAIQLASYLYSELEVSIQVQELLEAPTIANIVELIQKKQTEEKAEDSLA